MVLFRLLPGRKRNITIYIVTLSQVLCALDFHEELRLYNHNDPQKVNKAS